MSGNIVNGAVNTRQAVFISGRGSNLKALIDSYPKTDFYVFANKACEGLVWAKRRGCYTEVVSFKEEPSWICFAKYLNTLKIQRIFLLGFLKIIPEDFLNTVKSKVVNLHPSVLPKFPGLNSIERSFEAQDGMGCSLHEVTPEVDQGEIILQKKIEKSSCLDLFKETVHGFEQRLVAQYFELNPELNFELTRGVYE